MWWMSTALLSMAQASEAEPDWLRPDRGPVSIPDPISRRLVANAKLGNALVPVGILAGAVITGLWARDGFQNLPLWGTMYLGALSVSGAGLITSGIANDRSARYLRAQGGAAAPGLGHVGRGLAAVGLATVAVGSGVALVDERADPALLAIIAGGGLLTIASTLPTGLQVGRNRRAFEQVPSLSLSPMIDPIGGAAGLRLTGEF